MRHQRVMGLLAAGALVLAGCGSNTEEQAASGAMGGAVAGDLVGGPIGAAVGAAAGGAGGSQADRVLENGASGGIESTDRTLAQSLEQRSGFSTFTQLADASGLTQELGGGGSYTIFAPTDEAFNALPAELRQRLDTDRELLRNVLNQHVVSGQALAADQLPQEVRTAGGTPIRVALADGRPVLAAAGEPGAQAPDPEVALGGGPGTARIVTGNIAFAEGVVHGIDQVLLPAGMR